MSQGIDRTWTSIRPDALFRPIGPRTSDPAVLRSEFLRIGTDTLGRIPHLNVPALVEKLLQHLGDAPAVRRFLQTGRDVVREVVTRNGITEAVLQRPSASVLRLLGPLGRRLEGVCRKVGDWIHDIAEAGIEKFGHLLDGVRTAVHGARDFLAFLDRLLPGDWSRWTRGLQDMEDTVARWVQGVTDFRQRLHQIHTMLCELLSLVRPSVPSDPSRTQVIIR